MQSGNRRLMWHGMCLFLIGLLTGFVEQRFTNVRMALAAHLEGVMNGSFLVAVGAVWGEVRLSPPAGAIAYWAMLYGTYGNWLVTTLAATFGTAALSTHRRRLQRETLAGTARHRRIHVCRYRHRCFLRACSVGPARPSVLVILSSHASKTLFGQAIGSLGSVRQKA